VLRATCYVQRAGCDARRATCWVRRATCHVRMCDVLTCTTPTLDRIGTNACRGCVRRGHSRPAARCGQRAGVSPKNAPQAQPPRRRCFATGARMARRPNRLVTAVRLTRAGAGLDRTPPEARFSAEKCAAGAVAAEALFRHGRSRRPVGPTDWSLPFDQPEPERGSTGPRRRRVFPRVRPRRRGAGVASPPEAPAKQRRSNTVWRRERAT
jgi:hypothetical protein